jgi:hypothetical protein
MKKLTKDIVLPISKLGASIKEGDGWNEKILFSQREKIHLALPDYWASLTTKLGEKVKPSGDDILDLTLPDQHTLAIEIFKLSYGNILELRWVCAGCSKKAKYTIDLDTLDFIPPPPDAAPPDPTFEVFLPRSKRRVRIGYVTGRKEREELDAESFDPNRADLRSIRSIEDVTTVSYEDVLNLPLMDHRVLREKVKEIECGYVTDVSFKHSCGNERTVNILLDPSFLVPGFGG